MRRLAILSGAGLCAVANAALAQDQASPAERWAQVLACAAERSNSDRHACTDNVLRAAGVLDAERERVITLENFGREERAAPPPAPAAAPPPPVPVAAAQAAPPPPSPPAATTPPAATLVTDSITTEVAGVRAFGGRRLEVTTREGAVWRQVGSDAIRRPPRVGESFVVREGALGGYRCTYNETSTFPCSRVD